MHHLLRPLFPFLLLFAFTRVAHAQIVNAGFESITIAGEDTLADDWYATSGFGGGVVDQAHNGDHAFGVWNWYYYAHGIARNGPAGRGTPITHVPARLLGWYDRHRGELQEEQSPNDSAEVSVVLTRWNAMAIARDTVAVGIVHLAEQGEWAPFQVDITPWSTEAPDTITVELLSGVSCFCGGAGMGYCCYLYVDDLELEFPQGVREALSRDPSVHVVATGAGLVVNADAAIPLPYELVVRDATGRTVQRATIGARTQQLSLPGSAGLYTFTACTRGRAWGSGKFLRP